MQEMLEQARHVQGQMQEKMSQTVVEVSGGGAVSVKMNGQKQVLQLKIDASAVMSLTSSPADMEMLEDLITAAFNEAGRRADEAMKSNLTGMLGGRISLLACFSQERHCSICGADGAADPRAAQIPGIGSKSAQRLAFRILRASSEDAGELADAVREVKARLLCARPATTSRMWIPASTAPARPEANARCAWWRNRGTLR